MPEVSKRVESVRTSNDNGEREMKCPHCGMRLRKFAVQMEDLVSWCVGWQCGCPWNHPKMEMLAFHKGDWTVDSLIKAGVYKPLERGEG